MDIDNSIMVGGALCGIVLIAGFVIICVIADSFRRS